MSALAGIYRLDAGTSCGELRPRDQDLLERLGAALEQRGPDGQQIRGTGPVMMLHRPFHVDRESRFTPQPHQTPDGRLVAWDGRLDNREDLRTELQADLPTAAEAGPRTLDFVLAAYRRWGLECFGRLIGDFALALWDPAQTRLILAADSMGLCPLYYFAEGDKVIWASSARALQEVLDLPLQLDDDYIANFLTEPQPTDRSPFRRIRAVPGSHALVVGPEGPRLHRYWQIDPKRELRYRREQEYDEHFLEVFTQAVECRLQTDGPVLAELSGGLDSSSIVCLGDRLIDQGRVSASEIHTISYVYDTSPAADERPYMRLIEEHRGRPGYHVRDEDFPILSPLPPGFKTDLPSSQISFLGRRTALVQEMKAKGARVVLRGEAGDQAFWGQIGHAPLDLADYLKQGRLVTLGRACRAWSRVLRTSFFKTFWQGAVWPLLPRPIRARTFYDEDMGDWLEPGFVQRMNLQDRLLGPEDDAGFSLPSNRRQYTMIRSATRLYALQMVVPQGHVEAYYPFLDRRLVEFALSLPVEQKLQVGRTRAIVRRGLKGILPDPVRQRTTKTGPTQAFNRALVREWPWLQELIHEPRICDLGIADRDAFAAALRRARHGLIANPSQLLRTISLELWLRSFEVGAAYPSVTTTAALGAAPIGP